MNKEISLPGYRMCDYMLVLQPHQELTDKIMQLKKAFAVKYDAPAAEWGKPNVPLAKFSQLQLVEDRLINRLNMIALAVPAFKVELRDFGSYPTHSIVINIDTKVAVKMLVTHLKGAQQLMKTNEKKPQFIEQSHLIVARKLLPWQFEKAWLEFSHRHFTGRFIAKDMLLLRKSPGSVSYQTIHRFEFKNMPVLTTQGALF